MIGDLLGLRLTARDDHIRPTEKHLQRLGTSRVNPYRDRVMAAELQQRSDMDAAIHALVADAQDSH